MGEQLSSFNSNHESIESPEHQEEEPQGFEGLIKSIREMSKGFESLGIPVDENLRLVMDEGDRKRASQIGGEFQDEDGYGEQLELLTVYLLDKYLDNEEFVSVRSALIDDYQNKVDIIILDRKTKTVICALDDVGVTHGYRFEEKKGKIKEINLKQNGARLKYCLNLDENDKFVIKEERNIPLTYLALSRDLIEDVIKGINSSDPKNIDMEKKVFNYFLNSINNNLEGLELDLTNNINQLSKKLDQEKIKKIQELLKKISDFRQSLENKIIEE